MENKHNRWRSPEKVVGRVILLFAMLLCHSGAFAALTPETVAQKAAAVISNAKGMSATFTLTANGHSSKGSLQSSGNKFNVLMPEVSTWYNGKALYTYNPRTAETTVTTPTAQELLESNPLLYVKGGGSTYTYKFSTVKRQGKYVLDLIPKNIRSGVKKLTFTINSTTYHPERIVVTTSAGTTVVEVTSLKTGITVPATAFEYPKAKYPKAEIVDLR